MPHRLAAIRSLFLTAAVTATLLVSALMVSALPAWAQSGRITLLSINDVYEIAPKNGKGGFAPLMTLLEEQRAMTDHSVTTVNGDFLSPSLLSGLLKGAQMIDFFNLVGVDYVSFGNHEFDFGPDVAAERIAESDFTWLGTNVLDREGAAFGGSVLTATRQMGEIKVGFLGLLTEETEVLSSPGEGIVIRPPLEAAAGAAEALKAQGAHVIVALTHMTLADDIALARAVPDISVILGGHEHTPITYMERGTVIQKAGSDAHYLAVTHLDVAMVEGRKGPELQVIPSWQLISTAGVAPHTGVAELAARYETKLDEELGEVVGTASVALDSRRSVVRSEESNFGNLIADAMRLAVGADVGLTNGGGIRGDTLYEAGHSLTRRDILSELPFGNLTVKLSLTGAQLRQALENGVSQVEEGAGRFPQISGMRFVYDPSRPAGERVVSVTVGGAPLDENRRYSLATNDYIAAGGDGYGVLADAQPLIDASGAVLMATTVMNHIAAQGSVAPQPEGRIERRP